MKRIPGWVLVSILLALPNACTTSRSLVVGEEAARPGAEIQTAKGQEIEGYTTIDGKYHKFDGRVRLHTADTLEIYGKHAKDRPEHYEPRVVTGFLIPIDSLQSVKVHHMKTVGTIVLASTVVLIAAGAIAIAASSCPFVYSYDGERYVFDGEPYGGATMRGLERTDWSELEHLKAVGGEYRLLLTNEVDEIQHTNSFSLLAVDHRPGSRVVMDKEGRPHAFEELVPLAAARDEKGKDLLPWLAANDNAAWEPNLKAYAQLDSIDDARNHITLEFPRPKGVTRAYLITNVATGQWGSSMIRPMLGLRGKRVGEFYAAINGSETARLQLFAWNAREELFELFPEVECGSRWERQDFIPAGGPYATESRAVPLDLSRVEGETVRIRIHPPIGFWSLNSFHLAGRESEAITAGLQPKGVRGGTDRSVLAVLGGDDDRYLDFPNIGDRSEVVFQAPPPRAGMERTVFARTRGWYEVNLHHLAEPDSLGIARLTYEPGYPVRLALREYKTYLEERAINDRGRPSRP